MKTSTHRLLNDRPHPSPLPQGREQRSPSHSKTNDWICPTLIHESRSVQSLFPLPGGEGRGEGGCNY